MMSILHSGPLSVFLQGENALFPFGETDKNQVNYYLGAPISKIILRDFRQKSVTAARKALRGIDPDMFVDTFNTLANVRILENAYNNEIAVELYDTNTRTCKDFLWLGVTEDNYLPAIKTKWLILRPFDGQRITLLSLVHGKSILFSTDTVESGVSEAFFSS